MKNFRWIIFSVLIGLAVCCFSYAPKPSIEDLNNIDMGPAPTEELAKKIALAYFNEILYDPFSAHYEFGTIKKDYYYNKPAGSFRFDLVYAWSFKIRVNAKNKMGGYVGWKSYKIFIRDDKIITVLESN